MTVQILQGDCREVLKTLPAESVDCIVTSPPYYGLRDYGVDGQIGLEETPYAYVKELVSIFADCRRVLKDTGTLWLNLGDSYSAQNGQRKTSDKAGLKQQSNIASVGTPSRCADGCKPKDLIGIPWMVAFALRADGWWLRQDIIWSKPNPMPESVTDRCTKAHEYLFLLSKSARYHFDSAAIAEVSVDPESHRGRNPRNADKFAKHDPDGFARTRKGFDKLEGKVYDLRNRRSVWTIVTQPYADAHFATFPPDLVEPCIKAGCPEGGTVLDPFGGAGTTGLVADRLQRNAILIELNPEYASMAERRLSTDRGPLLEAIINGEATDDNDPQHHRVGVACESVGNRTGGGESRDRDGHGQGRPEQAAHGTKAPEISEQPSLTAAESDGADIGDAASRIEVAA